VPNLKKSDVSREDSKMSGEAVAVHISFHVVAGFLDVLDCPQLLVLAKIVVLFILLYMTGTSRGLPHMYQ
jgi:hypothetical protein